MRAAAGASTSAKAAAERAKGRRVWFYNGGRPNGPSPVIDAPATEARVVAWAAFKHDADTYFYWHGVHWRHNSQKQGERKQNVWANPITFDNRGQPNKADFGFINGDGVLLYPGEDVIHPERGPRPRRAGRDGAARQPAPRPAGPPVPGDRAPARARGRVRRALAAVVPRVFSDAGERRLRRDGDMFEAARRELADAIVAARKGAVR